MASKPLRIHPEAEEEYLAAVAWYLDQSTIRLLDPKNIRVSLDTITQAAKALGKRLIIRIADAKAG